MFTKDFINKVEGVGTESYGECRLCYTELWHFVINTTQGVTTSSSAVYVLRLVKVPNTLTEEYEREL